MQVLCHRAVLTAFVTLQACAFVLYQAVAVTTAVSPACLYVASACCASSDNMQLLTPVPDCIPLVTGYWVP